MAKAPAPIRDDPKRYYLLRTLWAGGWTIKEIGEVYGGTEQGVRSTIRKMRARGELPNRRRVGSWGWRP